MLAEQRIGALPVMDGQELVGIFSERDVIYRLRESGAGVLALPVGQVMTTPPVTATAETSALEALTLMTQRRIRHLPIVEGKRMIAFVSIGDLVKHRLDKVEREAAQMRTYIQTA
ncbi:CBS domain-containing protein [Novosphingobium colocasiae]|uniref:CBS domain-containing protein n=1 Tax=Novosphingobium colocasiae TaxID=1256513 RepID=A0A918UGG5_9SPHN|nr:CBS domain-containing protein [Novosphingobium colocasiae]